MGTKQISKGEKRMNFFLSSIGWLFIVIGIAVIGYFFYFSLEHISTNNAQVRQYITPVASKVSGFIEKINFEENQMVHKGDTLIIIDNREFNHALQIASANLETTSQTIATVESEVDVKASTLSIVDAKIEAVQVEIWRLEHEYERFKNLVEEDAATVQQFEAVEAKFKQAKAELAALKEEKHAIEVSTYAQKTKVAPVKTQVSERKAQVDNAKLILSYTYVLAPYDGWVGTKTIQEGQLIKEGQALVQVVSKEKWIIANFKETQLGKIDLSKDIEITADAYPDLKYYGRVESLSPAAGSEFSLLKPDNATGNFVKIEQRFPVKIILNENQDLAKLRAGMNVYVAAQKTH